ncbi:YicC family protein [Peptoniphilus equinus]|uniref:YicC family protein n=1 Tax=Peptoniphilus equinus TaxID=3016343 RepID=A0ABY7QSF9_9FIRM|nr:YicC/YloC family endoribonuclease [Peptoniphilus equinus]WBW49261.1 YicC family protein [Peptoniphilus equinus]
MNSMTGYGRGEFVGETYSIKVEIRSVNNRFTDVNIRLPHILFPFEEGIRRAIKSAVARGKLDVYINLKKDPSCAATVQLNKSLAQAYLNALEDFYHESKFHSMPRPRFIDILEMDGVLELVEGEDDENIYKAGLFQALEEALTNLLEMRRNEGENLKASMINDRSALEGIIEQVATRAPQVIEDNRRSLKDRVERELKDVALDEGRLATELAIMSDKLAIDEEIQRLYSHLNQFDSIIQTKEPAGRKLDFLIQEFNREINTIGSKTSDADSLNLVVEMKSIVEKLREQTQNIE